MEFIIGMLIGNAVVLGAVALFFNGKGFTNKKSASITLTAGKRTLSKAISWDAGYKMRIIPQPVIRNIKFK